ncbi:flavodoxin family protein [Methanofollis formosanus]|uniref:Flavodoxin family protein n=1 Tax=Methanofollis formosanus TaxID=299308 RepID=A0A8G1A3S0_9EURY|nr:flavodoxin family protein [Methanofollis formosanus]QYZ79542.1 flavodoxin family protein [Methanofollis formosanus]
MTVKVLGISGSPHRHGNTETLLDAFLEGAEEAGGEVEKVVLRELKYSACRGCNACHTQGVCVVKDDLTILFKKIEEADVLAVASPIYSMGITADLKGLIDRAQFLWARKFVIKDLYFTDEHMRAHKGIFISTAGQKWDYVFDSAYPMVTAFFNGTGFEYYDNVIANNMDEYGGIRGHPTALTEAKEKGKEVVGEVVSILTTGTSTRR